MQLSMGLYAANAMRLEKGYRGWGSDLTTERTPDRKQCGFPCPPRGPRFVKSPRDALLALRRNNEAWDMVLLEVEPGEVDPFYAHGLCIKETSVVGVVTSGAYGHRIGQGRWRWPICVTASARDNLTY